MGATRAACVRYNVAGPLRTPRPACHRGWRRLALVFCCGPMVRAVLFPCSNGSHHTRACGLTRLLDPLTSRSLPYAPRHDLGAFPVLMAMRTALTRHPGTLAFGSLLITALQVLKFIVALLMRRLAAIAGDSKLAKLLCCCILCCVGCIDRSVKYISRNAYVCMMLHGSNFCSSATEAVGLLTRHLVKMTIVRSIGTGFLLLGKLFVAAAAAATGALYLLTQAPYDTELWSVWPSVAVIGIGAWAVAASFMGVYNMAIDTIFLCYAVDLERAKHGDKLHSSTQLQQLVKTAQTQKDAEVGGNDCSSTRGLAVAEVSMSSEACSSATLTGNPWAGSTSSRREISYPTGLVEATDGEVAGRPVAVELAHAPPSRSGKLPAWITGSGRV
jgi:hypothetical protein